jgi:pimeloyl-ACP methyl ester carboxylesterase
MERDCVTLAGLRTHYWHAGTGPALFMFHGQLPGSCVATEWGDNVQRFADAGFEVHAPDLAGFGQSDNPADYSFKARIAHAKAFIDHFSPRRYSIWGSSIGTYKGCAIALEDARVDKLVIMPSTVLPPPMPEGAPSAVPLRESVAKMVRSNPPTLALSRRVLERVMSNKGRITDELVRLFYENWKGKGEEAERKRARVGLAPPLHQELHRLKNRSLLLWGADEALPERAILLQRCIPGAELHMLQGCAHWPQIDQPERTFEIVSGFLRS